MTRASRDIVRLGRIVGLFGVRGWVKVYSYTEPREGIVDYRPWLLGYPAGWQEQRVLDGRRSGRSVIAQLEGVGDRESAGALLGLDERGRHRARVWAENQDGELTAVGVATARA